MPVSFEARPVPAKAMAVSSPHRHSRAKAMPVSFEARPAPAKATAVSHPHRHKRAKATAVSDKRAVWSTGPRCDARGRRLPHRQPNFARNLSRSFFNTPKKRCNSNDMNSMFETVAGELRAKLVSVRCGGQRSGGTRTLTPKPRRRCRGRLRDLPRCRWVAAGPGHATHRHPDRLEAAARPAGPGRASSRRAERSSWRGRRAGGQATRRPEICRGNKPPPHTPRRHNKTARPQWGRAAVAVALGFEPRVAVTPHSISSAAPSAARTRYLTRILYYTLPPSAQIDRAGWEQGHTAVRKQGHTAVRKQGHTAVQKPGHSTTQNPGHNPARSHGSTRKGHDLSI